MTDGPLSSEGPIGRSAAGATDQPHTTAPKTEMTQHPDPTATITPTTATQPFRVEPAVPVPDDAQTAWPQPTSPSPSPPPHRHGVTVRRGPRPGAVVLGLLSLLVAAYVIAVNVSDAHLELRLVGPALVGALGGLLLLVGLAGVVLGRLRR